MIYLWDNSATLRDESWLEELLRIFVLAAPVGMEKLVNCAHRGPDSVEEAWSKHAQNEMNVSEAVFLRQMFGYLWVLFNRLSELLFALVQITPIKARFMADGTTRERQIDEQIPYLK